MENNFDLSGLEFIDYYIAEKDLIKRLTINSNGTFNFSLFSNLLWKPFKNEGAQFYDAFYVGINLLRTNLGFENNSVPGDFDILIIPTKDKKCLFERTCVVEVKIVRPRRNNPNRSPNSSGSTQIKGLIEDGFPLVGLLHVSMTEPLLEEEKPTIKFKKRIDIDNMDDEEFKEYKIDTFGFYAAKNQMKRLLAKEFPKYVGLKSIALNVTKEGHYIIYNDFEFNIDFEPGYFNPRQKVSTIKLVESYLLKNRRSFRFVRNES